MTVLVAVRTLSAIIFAADSKLTTYGRVGFDEKGEAIIVPQTYDNATKIVSDQARTGMAAVAGSASMGKMSFMDYIASTTLPTLAEPGQQEKALDGVAQAMAALRAEYWSDVALERWPVTQLLVATSSPDSRSPLLWEVNFQGKEAKVELVGNRVYFAGTYQRIFPLLYGYDLYLVHAAAAELKAGEQPVNPDDLLAVLARTLKVLKPIEQMNPHVMPIQDAVDFAYFLATTEIQMERFLPGEAACGGPVDVMVLKTSPATEILWYPGKELHHPGLR